MEKVFEGVSVSVNEEGYLTEFCQWDKGVAMCIAAEEGIQELTDKHWEALNYIQDQFQNKKPLSIRGIKKSGVLNIKDFYALFPGGPLKKASKIAGIPKPVSCI
jgi:tRNA 2-thiouridine synthesizing protein E